jgi:hypothetical protein
MSDQNTRPDVGQDRTDPSIDPTTATPSEGDILTEVAALDESAVAPIPNVERDAQRTEMMSHLRGAVAAAEKLAALSPEEEPEADAVEPDEESPTTDPLRPFRRSLAMLSDGRVALSLNYLDGADLTGYERWEGVILPPDQGEEVLQRLSDAADNVAASIGGTIIWKREKPGDGSGGDGDE